MTAPAGFVIHYAFARRRLLTRIEALRQRRDLSGRVVQIRFPGIEVTFLAVTDKSPTRTRGRCRWESDCSGPVLRNHACAFRAEMGAMVLLGIISETLALTRRLTQFRTHFQAVNRAG